MNKIKLFVVLLFLSFGMQQAYSQTYKFKTSGVSVLEKNNKGKWGKWSDLKQQIIFPLKKMILTLFIPSHVKTIMAQIVLSLSLQGKCKKIESSCILHMTITSFYIIYLICRGCFKAQYNQSISFINSSYSKQNNSKAFIFSK